MFLLLLLLISFSFYFVFLTWCLRLHARVLRRPFCVDSGNSMCFSYWKNVRLKPFCLPHSLWHRRFQLLLKECTIEAIKEFQSLTILPVSVVIERMYDWSVTGHLFFIVIIEWFQLLLKECTIEAHKLTFLLERESRFSCYWKNVRLKLFRRHSCPPADVMFQLLLKECTIEAWRETGSIRPVLRVSVVIERMYDWSF